MRTIAMSFASVLAVSATLVRASDRSVTPGGIVRWPAAAAVSCGAGDRSWAPIDGSCYFPIDLLATGRLRLEVVGPERVEAVTVTVGSYPYPEQRLKVEDRMVHLSQEDLDRVARENAQVAALWPLEGEARFSLPLAPPLAALPAGGRFGARRVFNDEPRSPHAGADYKASQGTPVLAAADGRVALAAEHFFGGKSVYLFHGGGLVTIYMHLSRTDVREGDEVRRGEAIGAVGATGRVTGPHLHFAVRWHGARVDPAMLLGAPSEIPSLGP